MVCNNKVHINKFLFVPLYFLTIALFESNEPPSFRIETIWKLGVVYETSRSLLKVNCDNHSSKIKPLVLQVART